MAEEFCTVLYLSTKTKPKNLNFLHNDLFYISFQINMTCLCKIAVMASANRIMDDSCNLGSHSRTSPSKIFWYHVGTKELTNTNTHKDEFVAMLLKCIYSDKKHKKPWKINTNSLSLPTWSSQTSTSSNMNESWQTQKFSISVRLQGRRKKTNWKPQTGIRCWDEADHTHVRLLSPTGSRSVVKVGAALWLTRRILWGFGSSKFRQRLAHRLGEVASSYHCLHFTHSWTYPHIHILFVYFDEISFYDFSSELQKRRFKQMI